MMTGDLLERLHGEGIELSLSPREGYVIARPETFLTEEIEEAIVEHKPEIIEILKEDITFRTTGVIRARRQGFDMAREPFGNEA
jgi:hypothetical protein